MHFPNVGLSRSVCDCDCGGVTVCMRLCDGVTVCVTVWLCVWGCVTVWLSGCDSDCFLPPHPRCPVRTRPSAWYSVLSLPSPSPLLHSHHILSSPSFFSPSSIKNRLPAGHRILSLRRWQRVSMFYRLSQGGILNDKTIHHHAFSNLSRL